MAGKNSKHDQLKDFAEQEKRRISEMSKEQLYHLKQAEKIDLELMDIQKSTRTAIPQLGYLHNFFRMHFHWYYSWSMNHISNTVHVGILLAYILGVSGTFVLGSMSGWQLSNLFQPAEPVNATDTWYDPDWGYRTKITIDDAKVVSDLSDFPVTINSTQTVWKTTANGGYVGQSSGQDFVITNQIGVKLSHEIESYSATTGVLVAHFKADSLSSSADTIFYLYYGNTSCPDQQDVANVWTNGYAAVWHMSQDPSGSAPQILDSTANNNDGTSYGTMTTSDQVAGKIDGSIDFDGSNDYLSVSDSTSLGTTSGLTLSAWIKFAQDPTTFNFMGKWGAGGAIDDEFGLDIYNSNVRVISANSKTASFADSNLSLNNWHQVVGTIDSSGNMEIFLNATSMDTETGATFQNTSEPILIGKSTSGVAGILDHLSVSNVVRSDDWITAEYNNLSSPSTFYALTDETLPAATSVSISGVCKQFDQATNCANSQTVKVAVNDTLQAQSGTTSSGAFTISGVSVRAGDILTVFVDGVADANEAVAVTKWDGTGNITGVLLYEEHVTVGSDDNQTLFSNNLGSYDNSVSSDEDIFFDVDSSGNLVVDSTAQTTQDRLYVKTGNSLTLSGNATASGLGVSSGATFSPGSNIVTLTGSGSIFDIGGTFNYSTSTVKFTGSGTASVSGGTYYDMEVNGSGGTFTLSGNATIKNTLTLAAGTLAGSSYTLTLEDGGTPLVSSGGSFSGGTSTVKFTSADDVTVPALNYNNLELSPSSEGVSGWIVSGAGVSAYNGTYSASGTFNNQPAYTNGTYWLYLNKDDMCWPDPCYHWIIYSTKTDIMDAMMAPCYYNNSTTLPGTWYAGEDWEGPGMGSAPSLSEGSGAATYTLASGSFDISGNLTVGDGTNGVTVDADTNDSTLNIGGSFSNSADATFTASATGAMSVGSNFTLNTTSIFTHSSGTVILDGQGAQTVTVNGTGTGHQLNNLTVTNSDSTNGVTFADSMTLAGKFTNTTASSKLTFNAGSTYAFDSLNLNGQGTGTKIVMRSSTDSTAWNLNVTDSPYVYYVDVKDSNASGGSQVNAVSGTCTDSTGNTNWNFSATGPTISISGTVYTADDKSINIGASKTVGLSINGGTKATVETTTGGAFSFSGVTAYTDATVVIFVDDETEEGTYVTQAIDDTTNITGLEVFTNHVVVSHETSGPMTNTILAAGDGADDDIKYSVTTGHATFTTGFGLWVKADKTYTPGGQVTAEDIYLSGTLNTGSNTINVSGDFEIGTGAISSSGTVNFNKASGTQTVTMDSGASNGWIVSGAGDTAYNGTYTESGTYNSQPAYTNGSKWLYYAYDEMGMGYVWALNSSKSDCMDCWMDSPYYDGSTLPGTWWAGEMGTSPAPTLTQSFASSSSFQNLTKSGGGTLQVLTNDIVIDGTLTIGSGTIFDTNGKGLTLGTLSNNGTLLMQGDEDATITTMDTNSGTVEYDGTGTYTSLPVGNSYYSLKLNGSGATWTLGANLSVAGVLNIASGTLNASSRTITLSGSGTPFIGSGVFTASTSTVIYTGTQATNVVGTTYYNLTINQSGTTFTAVGNITIDNILTVSAGTFAGSDKTISLEGEGTPFVINGTFSAGTSTVKYVAGADTTIAATTYYNLETSPNASGSGGWVVAGAGNTSYNGTYTEAGTHNSKPYYTYASPSGTRYLSWTTGYAGMETGWVLNTALANWEAWMHYYFTSSATLPGTWYLGDEGSMDGGGPAPTLTAGTSSATYTFASGTVNVEGNYTNGDGIHAVTTNATTNDPIVNINGSFTNSATATFVASNSGSFSIASSFINNATATFTHSSGTLVLDGQGLQTITANGDSFNNLSITNASSSGVSFEDSLTLAGTFTATTASSKITFHSSSTYAFNAISINGQSTSTRITLTSSSSGSPWNLNITAASPTASNVSVKDSNANKDIDATSGGQDLGGNTHWLFGASGVSISGTVYTAENKSTNIGAGKTVALSINGATATTAETTTGGAFSFTGITVASNNSVALYLDGETEKASYITQAVDSSTDITGLELFSSHLVLSHQTAGPMTNTLLDTADNVSDTDLLASVSSSNVTFTAGIEVWVLGGKTYTPGGNVTAAGFDILSTATFSPEANTLTLTGAGTPFAVGGTFNESTSTVVYTGSGATNVAGTTYNNLILNQSGTTFTSTGSTTVKSTLTITAGTLDASSQTITLTGSTTPFVNSGTFTASTSTVKYQGTSATNITAATYYNLEFSPASGTPTYTLATGTINTNNLTIGDGTNAVTVTADTNDPTLNVDGTFSNSASATFVASATGSFSVASNFTNSATGIFTDSSGTLTLDGQGLQTITAGGTTANYDFYNLTVTNASASGVSFADSATVTGTFTDVTATSKLTFNAGSTYAFANISINGQAAETKVTMTGSATWYFNVSQTSPSVSYVSVTNSNASGGNEIDATTGCDDGTGNTNWVFTAGVTRYWDNDAADGDWGNYLNWSGDTLPSTGDDVIFDSTSDTPCTLNPVTDLSGVTLGSITLESTYTSTLTLEQTMDDSADTLTVSGDITVNGGTMLVQGEADGTPVNGLGMDIAAVNVTIGASGHLSADGQGFAKWNGPGGDDWGGLELSGIHGGQAYDNAKSTYGSISDPTSLGSGGNSQAGGGAIKIIASGNLIVNGSISANGAKGDNSSHETGAGGSVNLSANVLSGSGTILANGGATGQYGSGGRISLGGVSSSIFEGSIMADGSVSGFPGTVYLPESWRNNLEIGGAGNISHLLLGTDDSMIASDSDDDYSFGNLTINDGGVLEIGGHPDAYNGYGTSATIAATNITVNSGGSIHADERGHRKNAGPGGYTENCGGVECGGSYGGEGVNNTGSTYGSAVNPRYLGSGGSSWDGSGAVILDVSGTLTVDGSISASSLDHPSHTEPGSGGSINITTGTLAGSGSIFASSDAGNSGGGGRVAITYTTDNSTLTKLEANSNLGAHGTVYKHNTADTHGDLYVDNEANVNYYTGLEDITGDNVFKSINILNYGKLRIGDTEDASSRTLTVDSDLTISSGGTLTFESGTDWPILNINGDVSIAGTITGVADLNVSGGDIIGDGTINLTGGTVLLDGTGNFGGTTNWTFNNLTFGDGTGTATSTKTSTNAVTVSGILAIAANQTFDASNATYNLTGSTTPFVNSGTFTASTSTIKYQGTSATNITAATYYNLEFSPPSGTPTYTLATGTINTNNLTIGDGTNAVTVTADTNDPTLNIDGTFSNSANATFVASNSGSFSVASNFTNSATGIFADSSGTLALDGQGLQTITTGGTTTNYDFYNLTVTNASAGGVSFADSATVTGTFTDVTASSKLTFNAGSTYAFANISINGQAAETRITMTGSATWYFNVSQTSPSVSYVSVTNSNASGGNEIDATTGCDDGTGNVNWVFVSGSGTDISGTVYTAENKSTNVGAAKTVALSINGATTDTVETSSGGVFEFADLTLASSDVIAIYLDDETEKASLITQASGAESIAGLELYTGNVVLRHESSGPITNTILATADNVSDSDLLVSVDGSNVANFTNTFWVLTGATYTPGGAIVATSANIDGTFNPGAYDLTLSGSWDANTGSLSTSGTVTFNASSGTVSIGSGGQSFNNVVINDGGGTATFQITTALDIDGTFTLTDGVLDLDTNDPTVNIAGDITINGGSISKSSADALVTFDGDLTYTDNVGVNFGDIQIGTSPDTTNLSSDFTCDSLTIASGDYFYTNGYDIDSAGSITINSTGTLDATDDGELDGTVINIGGDWSNSGAFTADDSQIIFDGAGAQSITAGGTGTGKQLYGLTVTNASAAGVTFADSLTITGTFTATTASTKLTFHAGSTYTFPTISINGQSTSTRITIVSSSSGSPWYLYVSATSPSASNVDVSDSDASGGEEIDATVGGVDSGGNDNWLFSTYSASINGRVYTDTTATTNVGANKTVALSVNGGTKTTDETDSNGLFAFSSVSLTAGDILTFFLDDETEKGNLVIRYDSGNLGGLVFAAGAIRLNSSTYADITNTHLDTADNLSDTDILFSVSGGDATFAAGNALWIEKYKTYRPGGDVTCHDVIASGTLNMESNDIYVSGSWDSTSGALSSSANANFNAASGTESINVATETCGAAPSTSTSISELSSSAQVSISLSEITGIPSDADSFYFANQLVSSSTGTFSLIPDGDDMGIDDPVLSFIRGNGWIYVELDESHYAPQNFGLRGTLTFSSHVSLSQNPFFLATGAEAVEAPFDGVETTDSMNDELYVDVANNEIEFYLVSGLGSDAFYINYCFTDTTIANTSFYNLNKSGGGTLEISSTNVEVSNVLSIAESNTLSLTAPSFEFASLSNSGTFTMTGDESVTFTTMDTDSGTVEYSGTSSYTSFPLGNSYNSLKLNGSGGSWTPGSNLSVAGVLDINAGTLNASDKTITLSGSGTPLVITGTFTEGTSTIIYTGTSATNVTGTTYHNLTFNQAGTTFTSTGSITAKNVLTITAGTFNASDDTIILSGTGTPFVVNGTFTAATSTVRYTGVGATSITATSYYNLETKPSAEPEGTGWTVSGAGDNNYNGNYYYAGLHNGNPYYTYAGPGGTYYLADVGASPVQYVLEDFLTSAEEGYLGTTGSSLPANPWTASWADGPAPTLSVAPGFSTYTFASGTINVGGNYVNGDGTNAIVTTADTNDPILNIDGSFTNSADATFIAPGGGALSIASDFTNNSAATFTHSSGTVTFDGQGTQTITPNGDAFNNIVFNNTGASGSFAIATALDVNGTLTLTDGVLDLDAFDPTVNIAGNITVNGGSVTNSSANSLVTLDGDLTYDDNVGVNFGDIQIGTSPDTTNLSSDMTCDTLTIATGDYLYTNGYDIDCAGDVSIAGTLDATDDGELDGTVINVGGSWSNSGTFTASNSTVIFDATDSGNTITDGGANWNKVEFNGSGGDWSFQDSTTITDDLIVTEGTLNGTNDITVSGGDLTGNGTINLTGGTLLLDGTGNFGGTTNWTFNNLTFGDGTGTATTNKTSTNQITVSGTLTIAANQTLDAADATWVLTGTGTPFVINGTFTASTSTVRHTGASDTNIATATYYNLEIKPGAATSGSWYVSGAGTTSYNGTYSESGTFGEANKPAYTNGTNWLFNDLDDNSQMYYWCMASSKVELGDAPMQCTYTSTSTDLPGTWYVALGTSPAPTVSVALPTYTFASGTVNIEGNFVNGDGTNGVTTTAAANDPTLNIDGAFTNSAGASFVASSSASFSIASNFTNSATGTFTHSSGTLTLDGQGLQTITTSGDPFNNLTVTNASTGGVTFADSSTVAATATAVTPNTVLTFTGGTTHTWDTINLNGQATGTEITMKSSDTNDWSFKVTTQTNVSYVDVSHSDASGGIEIDASDGTNIDSLNNTNWLFIPLSNITGTVYTNTDKSTNIGASKTVAISVNGGAKSTVETATGGTFSFSVDTPTDSVVSIFVDDETEKASLITQAIGTGTDITGLELFTNNLVITHETAGPIANTNLTTAYTLADADLLFATDVSDNATITTGITTRIATTKSYTPGANLTTPALNIIGTFTPEANTTTLTGSGTPLTVTGTFTEGTSTTIYTGSSATNITGTTYYNLTLNQSGTTFTSTGNITVKSIFTITAGTFDASDDTITLEGSGTPFVVTGTFTPSTSTIKYAGTSATNITATTYHNLTTDYTGTTFTLANNSTINGVLTVNAGTFTPNSKTITLAGSGTPFVINDTFTASGTIKYTGTSATNVAATTYNTLTLDQSGTTFTALGDVSFYGLSIKNGAFETVNNLTMDRERWAYAAGAGSLSMTGGTFTYRGGRDGSFGPTGSGDWQFNNLDIKSTDFRGGVSLHWEGTGKFIVNGNLKIEDLDYPASGLPFYSENKTIEVNNFINGVKGTFYAPSSSSFKVFGNWSNAGGFSHGSGTVTFAATSTGKTIDNGASSFYNLVFDGVGGGWSTSSDLTVAGNMTLNNGVLDASTNNSSISIDGSFTNNAEAEFIAPATASFSVASNFTNSATGTFTHSSGTLTLDGQGLQTITTGGDLFNNLTITNASAGGVTFADSSTVSATATATTANTVLTFTGGTTHTWNTINLNGQATGTEITMQSSDTNDWNFNVTTQTAVSYVDVSHSDASGGVQIDASDGTNIDSGNNTNWLFIPLSGITGTVYTNVDKSTNIGASKTVAISVNGGTKSTAETAAGGTFSFDVETPTDAVIAIFVDDETEKAALITQAIGTGTDITGLELFTDNLVITHETAGPIANTHLTTAYALADTDLLFATDASDNATISTGITTRIASAKSYTPGANLTTPALNIIGIFTPEANTTTLTGSGTPLEVTGTFIEGTSSTIYTGTSATGITGTTYYNLTMNQAGTTFTSTGNSTVKSVLTITAGTFDADDDTITLEGSGTPFVATGTFTPNTSTIKYTGTTATNVTGTTYYNLTTDYAGTTFTAAGNITVSNVFTIQAGIFNASDDTITLEGSGTPFVKNGTFTRGTSTIKYSGTSATSITGADYYRIVLDQIGTTFTAGANFNVYGQFIVENGTFDASNKTIDFTVPNIYYDQGFVVNGAFQPSTSTMSFGPLGSFGINIPGGVYYNLDYEKKGAGYPRWVLDGDVEVKNTLTGGFNYTGCTMDFGNHIVTLSGSGTPLSIVGPYLASPSTFIYSGSSLTYVASIPYHNLTFSGTGTYRPFSALDVNGAFTLTSGTFDLNTYDPTLNIAGDISISGGSIIKSSTDALVTLDGDLTYTDSVGVNFGDVVIGTSPDTTDLASNMVCDSLTIAGGDFFYTNGYDVDVANDVTIQSTGTLDATDDVALDSTLINVGGTWTNSGTFTAANSTVIFDATDTGNTITDGGANWNKVEFNGFGGGWSFQDSTTITDDMIVTTGTLSGTNDITVNGGDITGNGTINLTGGTLLLDGTGNFGGTTNWTFNNLTFGDGTGTATSTKTSTNAVTVSGVLTTAANQTFDASNATYTLTGSTTPFVNSGTFTASTSTVKYQGTSATNITAATYYNLEFSPASGTPTYTLATGTINTNNLTIGDGTNAVTVTADTNDPTLNVDGTFSNSASATFVASATGSFSVASNFTNSATGIFTDSSGTLALDGQGLQTITAGGTTANYDFYNLTVTNASASGVSFADSATVTGTFTDVTASSKLTFNAGSTYAFANININGQASETMITMVSDDPDNVDLPSRQWFFNVSQTSPQASYVNVTDSDASGGNGITPINCTDGGNNENWLFNTAPANTSLTFTNPYSGTTKTAVADDTTEWNFQAVVSDDDGSSDLDYVELRLANSSDATQPYDSLKFRWTESTDTFSEVADTQSAASITSASSDSTADGNQWTLNFKIKFNSSYLALDTDYAAELYTIDDAAVADTDNYAVLYNVTTLNITLDLDYDTIDFGSSDHDSAKTGTTIATVGCNHPNGYTLSIADGVSGSDSALLHADDSTRVADYAGTIATPTLWSGYGLGFTVFSATDKDTDKWGTGTTETDSNNKYAGVPAAATIIHSKTGSPTSNDQIYIGYKILFPSTQKSGSYSGNVTFTATGVLN